MTIPFRGETGSGTYFITCSCWEKRPLFQTERMATLLLDVLQHYRQEKKYLLHEFVIMPNHLHLLLTPLETIEKAMQLIKGGFSFRAKREFGFPGEIWQTSFYDHRVRDEEEYGRIRTYIRENPVRRGLASAAFAWKFGSAVGMYALDEVPRRLKPLRSSAVMTQG